MKLGLFAKLLALLVALAVGLPGPTAWAGDTATKSERARAEKDFGRAQKAFDKGQYERALETFLEVAKVLRSPNAAFMAGLCLKELDLLPEAFEQMAATAALAEERAKDDKSYKEAQKAAEAEVKQLEALVGRVVIQALDTPEGMTVMVEERKLSLDQLGKEIGVNAGTVVIDATAPGMADFSHERTVEAGQLQTIMVVFDPATAPVPDPDGDDDDDDDDDDDGGGGGSGVSTAGFVVLGLGVLGMGTFVAAGVMANGRYTRIENECGQPPCTDPTYADVIDEGKTLDLVANIGLGVGAAGIVLGTIMILVGMSGDDEDGDVAGGVEI
ncbi:MAG: hypothetical protein JRI68_34105, partial [Deltaproteobacteria bacterium]|nr:hypothetical protein [Deltaproteobacteria bacterium]